jgi:hypothetical protein
MNAPSTLPRESWHAANHEAESEKKAPSQRLIENYGLFWLWENVHTGGGQGQQGKLLGHPKNRRRTLADFSDQRGIYALYAGYEFVYAGQIGRRGLLKRLKEHLSDDLAERWDRFSFFGTRRVISASLGVVRDSAHPKADVVLDQLETFLIHVTAPSLNNNRGRWRGATRYYQKRDERLGKTQSEMLRELHKRLVPITKK